MYNWGWYKSHATLCNDKLRVLFGEEGWIVVVGVVVERDDKQMKRF